MIDPAYIEVLRDSFLSYFIFTISGDFAYPVVLLFGGHDRLLCTLFALIGSTAGLSATYLVFFLLAKLLKKQLDSNHGYPSAQHYTSKLSPIFGAITAIPQLAAIPVFFFGVTKMDFKKFLLVIIFYRIIYYSYMLYTTHVLFQ